MSTVGAQLKRAGVSVALIALVASGLAFGSAAVAGVHSGERETARATAVAADASDCIRSDERGEAWDGDVSATLRAAEEELAAYVHVHPETTTLLGYCSDRTGLLLTAPALTPEIEAAMASARRHLSDGETIVFAPSASARGVLEEAIATVLRDGGPAVAHLTEVAVGRAGTIQVTLRSGAGAAAADEVRAAFRAILPDATVDIAVSDEQPVEFVTPGGAAENENDL